MQILRKKFFAFIFTVLTFNPSPYCLAADNIIAIVNDDIITKRDLEEFENFLRMQLSAELKGPELEKRIQTLKPDMLDKLIDDCLILQEAKKGKVKIDEGRVKDRIEEIKKRYGSDLSFQQSLSQEGLTQADLEQKIRDQMLMSGIIESQIRSKIRVNPTEVTDFYNQHPQNFILPQGREVTSIGAPDGQTANDVYKRLLAGTEPAKLTGQFPITLNKITVRPNGEIRKDIEEAVSNLSPGQIAGPIRINENFYLFRVDSIIPPKQETLSESQDNIYNYLFDKKFKEAITDWLKGLKESSHIKII
jgi:parvulin-like peptidyl-prolyl isomerase